MIKKFLIIFTAPTFEEDEGKTRIARLLNVIVLSSLLAALLYLPFTSLERTPYIVLAIGLILMVWLAMKRGFIRFASIVLVVGISAVFVVSIFTNGGVQAPEFSGLIIVILFAGILIGWKTAIAMMMLSILYGMLLLGADSLGWLPAAPVYGRVYYWILESILLLMAGVMLTLSLRLVNNALSRVNRELEERKRAEEQILQMKRLYATLSQVNQTIVRVKDRDELYQSICKVAVQFGELSFAWIGIPDDSGEIRPTAVEGMDLDNWPLPPINYKQGPGHTGIAATAMRTSEVTISNNIQTDERTSYLFEYRPKYDFHSVAAIPFQLQGRTAGVLSLGSSQKEFFKAPDELRLLTEMGQDISFALEVMEAEHTRAYLASIVESSHDAIIAKDLNSVITSWNKGAEITFGYTAREMIGQSILRLIPSEKVHEETEILEQIKQDQPIDHFETVRIGKNGQQIDVSVTISPVKDAKGNVIGASKVARNITARKQAERQILQMKRLYATLSQVNQTIVRVKAQGELYQAICDVSVKFGEFSLAWIGLLDEASGEIRPAAAKGLDVNQWPFPIVNIYNGVMKDGLIASALLSSKVVTSKDMQTDQRLTERSELFQKYDYRSSAAVPFRLKGKTIGLLNLISNQAGFFEAEEELRLLEEMSLDISFALDTMEKEEERKRAGAQLRQSEEQFRRTIELAPNAFLLFDHNGKIVLANQRAEQYFGYTHDELMGTTAEQLIPEHFRSQHLNQRAEFQAKPQARYMGKGRDLYGLRKDGTQFPLEIGLAPLETPDGTLVIATLVDSTVRKQAQEAIKDLSRFPEENPQPVLRVQANGNILYANSASDLLLEEWHCKVGDDLPSVWKELTAQVVSTNIRESVEVNCKDLIYSITFGPVIDRGYVNLYGREITEEKRTQDELQRNEQVLRLFVENSPAAIAMFDREMKYIVASHRYLVDYELGEQDLVGRSHYEVFPDIPDRWRDIHRRCLAGAIERAEEDPFPRASGKLDWVHWEIHPWYEINREIGGIILFSEVITERKRAQEALQKSEKKYRSIFDGVQDAIFVESLDGNIIDVNQRACEIFGYGHDEFITKSVTDIIPSDKNMVHIPDNPRHALEHAVETINIRANGEHFPVEIHGGQYEFDDRKLFLIVLRDITERKQTERALQEKERLLSEAQRIGHVGSWSYDLANDVLQFSEEMYRLLDISREEWTPTKDGLLSLVYVSDRPELSRWMDSITAARQLKGLDFRIFHKNGELRYLQINGALIFDTNGKPVRFVGTLQDITESKLAEIKIHQQVNRLRALRKIDQAINLSFNMRSTLGTVIEQTLMQLQVDAADVLVLDSGRTDADIRGKQRFSHPNG